MASKPAIVAKAKEPIQEGDCCYALDLEVEKSKLWTQQVLLPDMCLGGLIGHSSTKGHRQL